MAATNAAALAFLLVAVACAPPGSGGALEPIDRVLTRSELSLGLNVFIRVLPDGRVFVSEERGSQLWLLDRDLKNARLIGDTSASNRFIPGLGYYIHPYLGDSSLLIRSGVSDGFVLDGEGRKVRAINPRGRSWGRGPWTVDMLRHPFTADGMVMALADKTIDTTYVVRASFRDSTRRDTVAMMTRQGWGVRYILAGDGAAMFSDGTIAIVRSADYSIDWIYPDNRPSTSQPLPHRWTVLKPEDKVAAVDSIRASVRGPVTLTPEAIPDTVPPISWIGTIEVDADDRLWIEKVVPQTNPYRPPPTGIFDIVDRRGNVTRRVRLPRGAVIKAFAPGRIYYVRREGGKSHLYVAATR